ncbi:DUF721 domain-containing protein [Polycladidibacter stylochi]|uniref:DUF721 domain-containing protein n=1 Tax=Polycladidibacter stylochi TaxID=1807766 RepID=UPI0009E89635|nr:DciA family protein [Pseudovibrio stylochi]
MKTAARSHEGMQTSHQLNELVGKTISPAARKRGFATVDLLAAWPELVGQRYMGKVQPVQLIWPRQKSDEAEQQAEPATLLVHCDGPTALFFTHEIPQVRERINVFFGWNAVGRIKVIQKHIPPTPVKEPQKLRDLSEAERERVKRKVSHVEDDRLRTALEKLGKAILAKSGNI